MSFSSGDELVEIGGFTYIKRTVDGKKVYDIANQSVDLTIEGTLSETLKNTHEDIFSFKKGKGFKRKILNEQDVFDLTEVAQFFFNGPQDIHYK